MYPETMVYTVGTFYKDRLCDLKHFIAKTEHEAVEMNRTRQYLYSDHWTTHQYTDEEGKAKKEDIYKVLLNRELVTVAEARNPADAVNRVKDSLSYHILSIKRQAI